MLGLTPAVVNKQIYFKTPTLFGFYVDAPRGKCRFYALVRHHWVGSEEKGLIVNDAPVVKSLYAAAVTIMGKTTIL